MKQELLRLTKVHPARNAATLWVQGHENVNVIADSRRQHSAWIGGSIVVLLILFYLFR